MSGPSMIYLIRRASTANDETALPVLLGRTIHEQLSQRGKQRAAELAAIFAGRRIAAVYSSPLARAVQTSRVIAAETGAPLTFCTSLTDVDTGAWEGLTTTEIMRDDRYCDYLKDPLSFGYPDGESLRSAQARAVGFIKKLAQTHANRNIVVVAHRQINRIIIASLTHLDLVRAKEIDQDPGCVNLIRVFRGRLELHTVNYTDNIDLAGQPEEEEPCHVSASTTR